MKVLYELGAAMLRSGISDFFISWMLSIETRQLVCFLSCDVYAKRRLGTEERSYKRQLADLVLP